ncbi:MAG: UDP-N-acetylmuramate dehydrogenase [Abyssibacter sp.]|uniref:UDP-N-acetylmuramate dehydrogenase n=1 Tax=Abyssibacter sp. TaxID=2320200 RepID=UPI00321A520F
MSLSHLRGELRINEPLMRYTSWRVGGPSDRYYRPADGADLSEFMHRLPNEESILWMGLGSNLLIRDGGFRGTTVSVHGVLDQLRRIDDTRVFVEAGVHCARLAKLVASWGLAGGEFFAGIPGTLGGALAMNAGAWGGETWSVVESVRVIARDGAVRDLPASAFETGYRSVTAPESDLWFVAAELAFTPDHDGQAPARIRRMIAERKASQPVGKPSCGSVFRNPAGDHAARLIEAAGLKGYRIGDAEVSPKHANFIINCGHARAADIESLITLVRDTVRRTADVDLIPEVRIVGEAA